MGYVSGVGREAPAFTLTATDGNEISLARYRGDWFVVLVFLPLGPAEAAERLARLSAAAGQFWGLRAQLVGICLPGAAALPPAAPPLAFPLVVDDAGVATAYGARFAARALITTTFIIDRAGKIVWTGEGGAALDPASLITALRDVAR